MLTCITCRELRELDPNIHWFCPRAAADDYGVYFDEDVINLLPQESDSAKSKRLHQIQQAEKRRVVALEACKIFAFDGPDAKPYQDQVREGLKEQLTRCDVCVREYHRCRSLLMQRLEADFDASDVQNFMMKFDDMNIARISAGLNTATEMLLDLPLEQRNILALGEVGMYALFEALNCIPFLKNEEALRQYFDRPFRLVQTKRGIKLPSCAPGMACFVFSANDDRSTWAMGNMKKIKRPLTSSEFDYSVKPFLETAISRVDILALEKEFLPLFWRGSRLIISNLTKDTVQTQLRAMDTNLYTLALEHFQIDDTHLEDLLMSYQSLMEISADDFWDAMGSITAPSIIEQIFKSPRLQALLKTTVEKEPLHLEEKVEWTVVMIKSIAPANLVPPVRAILDHLFVKLQTDVYSRYARSVTWTQGFACLLTALKIVREKVQSGPLITGMIQIVAQDYVEFVMQDLTGMQNKNEMQIEKSEQMCLDIIEHSLSLDIAALSRDRDVILKTKTLDHELGISGLSVWRASMRHVNEKTPLLTTSILSGISGLLGLETLTSRQIHPALKPAQGWNDALKRVLNYVCDDLLERLETFNYDGIVDILQEPKGLQGLIMLLFNGEPRVRQAALNVFKTLSYANDRRGSLMHVLKAFDITALPSISAALDKISRSRVFAPCSIGLKIGTDVLGCLCDTQDGLLRSSNLSKTELDMLKGFWLRTWEFLGMIFEQTEAWSNIGHDKDMMQDFCRETMDFADHAFEQYAIIASTLQGDTKHSSTDTRRMLLENPKSKFMHIAKWLRLRDDYLIEKAVSLTVKILGRLQEVGLQVGTSAAQYIENIVMSGDKGASVKTKLNVQHKAKLRRALEKHLGESLIDLIDVDAIDRPKKQMDLQQWTASGRSSGASTPEPTAGKTSRPGTIDVDAWTNVAAKRKKEIQATEEEEMKKLMGSMSGAEEYRRRQQQQAQQQKKPSIGLATVKAAQKQQIEQKKFLENRAKEKAEMERRKKAALAKATGVGPGSGVAGLGDIGKDHSLKGQGVMVSDEESANDDDDDDDGGLEGGIWGTQKKEIRRPNVDPNGAVGLKPEQKTGPTKIQRVARSFKDMRARLAPDLTPLHRVILKWDFFHDGDYPPGAEEHRFRQVANSFNDPTTYRDTFHPLLTLEAWQGMVKAREESSSKPYQVKIQNRTYVDSFIEISSIIGHNENREIQLQESDIILLSKAKNPIEDATAPHCLARVYRIKRQKAHCEVLYQVLPGTSLAPSLIGQAVVCGVKVQSITPLEREYGALQALQFFDLCQQIIKAKPSKRLHFSEKQVGTYQDVWNVNRAQSEAINAALENDGFSLIQGPPGSGKTKTIVAIVGGLLTPALSAGSSGTKITMPKAHGNQVIGGDAALKKLLVCAPSNAAVDELVIRLKDGVKTKGGRHHQLNVVRIGRSEAINAQVLDVTMDELVAKRLGNNENDHKMRERNGEVFKQHESVSAQLRELYSKRDGGEVKGKELSDLETQIASTRKLKNDLGIRIDNAKDAERNAGREAELNRKRAQQAVLDEAHVICATLSGSGHDMFQSLNIEFEIVIIDEAAQCVEMSSLIPLKYGCVKCIMVGDPKQLPPTVFSKEAAKFQYEQSLFVRMQNNFADEVHLLNTQYRMHPEISLFPSRTFYDDLLMDGKGMAELRQKPWHVSSLLAPYRFFDVVGQHQAAPRGHSLINLAEIEIAIALYDRLLEDFSNYQFSSNIGIITPYKSQLKALKDRFSSRYGSTILEEVEFNTTDAFQGRESEIIIFSCVRASPVGGIGFLQDIRRMNVGLTRAKSSLWVLGNSESLVRGHFWKKLVEDARARDCYTSGNLKDMLRAKSSSYPALGQRDRSMLDVSSHVSQMDRGDNGRVPSSAANPLQPNAEVSKAPSNTERMEGIRYRFEDRLSKRNMQAPHHKNSELSEPQDVEMGEADSTAGGSATSSNAISRAETPLSGEERKADQANGNVKPIPGYAASSVPQPPKKRQAPTPFMPRKQPRPKAP